MNEPIQYPWEEEACYECKHCYLDDLCDAHPMGATGGYCPHIKGCKKFEGLDGRSEFYENS